MNLDDEIEAMMLYLRDRMQGYPFDERKDVLFVNQLIEDFPDIEHLGELKSFRVWLLDRDDYKPKHFRSAILKWFRQADRYNGNR